MTDNERLKKVVYWLISQGEGRSQEDVAIKLGHSKSYLSTLIIGQKKISEKFTKNLSKVFNKVNPDYILRGTGDISLGDDSLPFREEIVEKAVLSPEAAARREAIEMMIEQNRQLREENKELVKFAAVLEYKLQQREEAEKHIKKAN